MCSFCTRGHSKVPRIQVYKDYEKVPQKPIQIVLDSEWRGSDKSWGASANLIVGDEVATMDEKTIDEFIVALTKVKEMFPAKQVELDKQFEKDKAERAKRAAK